MKFEKGPYLKNRDGMTNDGPKSVTNDKIHQVKNTACIGTKMFDMVELTENDMITKIIQFH